MDNQPTESNEPSSTPTSTPAPELPRPDDEPAPQPVSQYEPPTMTPTPHKKSVAPRVAAYIIVLLILIAGSAFGFWYFNNQGDTTTDSSNTSTDNTPDATTCTDEDTDATTDDQDDATESAINDTELADDANTVQAATLTAERTGEAIFAEAQSLLKHVTSVVIAEPADDLSMAATGATSEVVAVVFGYTCDNTSDQLTAATGMPPIAIVQLSTGSYYCSH
jgi:hypothetical protein